MTKANQRMKIKHDKRTNAKHDKRTNAKHDKRDTASGAQSIWVIGTGIVGTSRIGP